MHERMIYQKAISEKTDAEIVALVVKQRTEAALEFQRSVELSLGQLSHISSESHNKIFLKENHSMTYYSSNIKRNKNIII